MHLGEDDSIKVLALSFTKVRFQSAVSIFTAVVKRQCRFQTSIALLGNLLVPLLASTFLLKFSWGKRELFGAQAPFLALMLRYSHCGHW